MTRRLQVLLGLLVLLGGLAMARWLTTPPKGPAGHAYDQAFREAEKGDFAAAIAGLKKAVLLDPGNGEYHADLGDLYLRTGDFEAAIAELQAAAYLTPQRPHVFCQLAQAYVEERRRAEALDALDLALKSTPDCAHALSVRGEQFLRDDNLKDALAAFQQVIRVAPDFTLAYQKSGYILLATNRVDEALKTLQQGLQTSPADPGIHALLGEAHARRAHDPRARQLAEYHYRLALPNNPDSGKIHAAMGQLYLASGQLEPARGEFQQAVLLQPYLNEALYGLVQIARREGKQAEAAQLQKRYEEGQAFVRRLGDLTARAQSAPQSLALRLELARIYLRAGLLKDAGRVLDAATALDPANHEARELRGQWYQRVGKGARASREFAVAAKLPLAH